MKLNLKEPMMVSTVDNNVKTFTRYNYWANDLIFSAVTKLPPGEATKVHENLFGSIVRVLNHDYIVGLVWKAHLEGREHGFTNRNPQECPPLAELWNLHQNLDKWYIAYYDELSFEELNRPVDFKLIDGTSGVMTRGEILLHIVNHNTYHRGFIADMFYKIPAKPPSTDLPVFLRDKR